jgi:hypothetical protein
MKSCLIRQGFKTTCTHQPVKQVYLLILILNTMKKEKMSIENMKNVLSHVLSREEMKEVMAGSGSTSCGTCMDQYDLGTACSTPGGNNTCVCRSGISNCRY